MPLTVTLTDGRAYPFVQRPLADVAAELDDAGFTAGPCLLVTDEHVAAHYRLSVESALAEGGWTPRTLVLPPGEASKSLHTLSAVYDWALAQPPSRTTPILALGGGVVGDLAGFAAATLLRGLPLVQLPTSLVAQVDSAVGGKTGVNHPAGKNLIGAFHQPRLVLADPAVLRTLPPREYRSGLAEVVKAALIADADFADWLGDQWDAILALEPATVEGMVRRAAGIKAAIVEEDERESGRRALLNFGHTFGHALERATDYARFTHGEAVALGMRAALHLSASLAAGAVRPVGPLPAPFDAADRLVARIQVEPTFPDLPNDRLIAAMATDKKRSPRGLRFIVLDDVGRARVVDAVPEGALDAAWSYVRAACSPSPSALGG